MVWQYLSIKVDITPILEERNYFGRVYKGIRKPILISRNQETHEWTWIILVMNMILMNIKAVENREEQVEKLTEDILNKGDRFKDWLTEVAEKNRI